MELGQEQLLRRTQVGFGDLLKDVGEMVKNDPRVLSTHKKIIS